MKKLYLAITMMFALMAVDTATLFGQDGESILFVGRGQVLTTEYQSDADLIEALEGYGYDVTYIWNDDFESASADTLYDGFDGVFMNETVDSESMVPYGPDDHNYPLPIITLEGYCANTNRWGWITNTDTELMQAAGAPNEPGTEDALSILIKDNSHYITNVFDVDEEVQWSNASGDDVAQVRPVSIQESEVEFDGQLATLAEHDNSPGFWNLVTIDELGPNGVKCVFWGLNHIGLNGADQEQSLGTDDFYTIIERAAAWTYADAQLVSVNEIKKDKFEVKAFPNPASDLVTLRYRTDKNVTANISLHDITGAEIATVAREQTVVGNNVVEFNVGNYTPGVYLVKVDVAGEAQFEKLIIE